MLYVVYMILYIKSLNLHQESSVIDKIFPVKQQDTKLTKIQQYCHILILTLWPVVVDPFLPTQFHVQP